MGPPSAAEISAAENENARLSKRVKELEASNADLENGLRAAMELLEQRWISVEERLPEECLYVIVYLQGKSHNANKEIWHMDADYFEDGDWHRYPENGYYKPTHWMPLPEPPKEE